MKLPGRAVCFAIAPMLAQAQSVDWTEVIWREPQVRYLLADLCLNGGKDGLYRKYAVEERDPDSREAIRLWDAGVRVVNTNQFERKWIPSQYAKDGRVMRIVYRGSERTIRGDEVFLSNDLAVEDSTVRLALLNFSLSAPPEELQNGQSDANMAEAIRRWKAGARVLNTNWFELRDGPKGLRPVYRETGKLVEARHIRLNYELPYPEVNVRYFMADMALGGSRDFYWRAAETAHEAGCLEAVLRHDGGVKITNLDRFERKNVEGKTLVTRKGSNDRISGSSVKLSTDIQP